MKPILLTRVALLCGMALALFVLLTLGATPAAAQKDFLSQLEADKIRDADDPREKIKLFALFAEDRWKKFQYEQAKGASDKRRAERMAALLDAFVGCMDDASELLQLGRTKQQDILKGVQFLQLKAKEFQPELERQIAATPATAAYKENLDYALLAVKEALEEAEKATKEISPGPVRRKQ